MGITALIFLAIGLTCGPPARRSILQLRGVDAGVFQTGKEKS